MRDYIEEACEQIDAAIFSGDAFEDFEHRKELRKYMSRWTNQMDEIQKQLPLVNPDRDDELDDEKK